MYRILHKNWWLASVKNNKVINSKIFFTPVKNFSSHHSDSDGDHHDNHDGHSDHEHHSGSETEDHLAMLRSRAFSRVPEKFSVEELLVKSRVPLTQPEKIIKGTNHYSNENEYVELLANEFRKKASVKYPAYKDDVENIKKQVIDFDQLNPYQQEVQILNLYMLNKLEKERADLANVLIGDESGTPLEYAQRKSKMVEHLIKQDTKSPSSNHIVDTLKKKLNKIIKSEVEFHTFKENYNKELEEKLVEKIVEKRNKTFYYDYAVNKVNKNLLLKNQKSPGNPHLEKSSVMPHDHINPQHFVKNPKEIDENKLKYLAYFDIILDQHMRQVRPTQIHDDQFKYVKNQYKPEFWEENEIINNMFFDYNFSLDNEFTRKLAKDMKSDLPNWTETPTDPTRPLNKLWKDKHKFPHVADRLGWTELQESPLDKNPVFERVLSHPLYQLQPFVQVPSLDPSENLCLEEGETVYENRTVYEWVLFWRLLILMAPLPVFIYFYETYNTQSVGSPEYSSRFSLFTPPHTMSNRGLDRPMMNKVVWWGKDMWLWQHWVRKGLFYPIILYFLFNFARFMPTVGHEYVTKMIFNQQKDVAFVWKTSGLFKKHLHVYEMHYLEQLPASLVTSWEHLGNNSKTGDGIITVTDMRTNDNLCFYNERETFMSNTMNMWKGLRHKNVNRGIFINNDINRLPEEQFMENEINGEIKDAIKKWGPITNHDYEYNYQYQFEKRMLDHKRELLNSNQLLH